MSALEGFLPVDISAVSGDGTRGSRCPSRELLQAFLDSGHDAMSKPMPVDELQREAYNLRHYRKSHYSEFGDIGISARNGQLTLFRIPE